MKAVTTSWKSKVADDDFRNGHFINGDQECYERVSQLRHPFSVVRGPCGNICLGRSCFSAAQCDHQFRLTVDSMQVRGYFFTPKR